LTIESQIDRENERNGWCKSQNL